MTTISLPEALELLESSQAVIVDDIATFANPNKITGDDSNVFASIDDPASDGEYSLYVFTEGQNQAPQITGTHLILRNDDGQQVKIMILEARQLERS